MKPGGGKGKGSEFERLICRMLTKWITGEEHPEAFWRSSSSGAKSTQDHKAGRKTDMHGDIMAVRDEGIWFTNHILVECKFYKDFRFGDLLQNQGGILQWWQQAERDGERAGKSPWLVFKRNRSPIYLMMDSRLWLSQMAVLGIFQRCFFVIEGAFNEDGGFRDYYNLVCLLEDYLELIDPVQLRQSLGEL